MTGDVAIVWDALACRGDWSTVGLGRLLTAPALETAVMVSLFTDARAQDDDVLPPGERDRRGWWGNDVTDQPVGSRLWLLRRAKHEPDTLRRARAYIAEALAWLVDDGLASRVDVEAAWRGQTRIEARIAVHRDDGGRAAVIADFAWQGIN